TSRASSWPSRPRASATTISRSCAARRSSNTADVGSKPVTDILPLALTMGEPGGIGPDVTLAAWQERRRFHLPPFYCLADPDMLAARARQIGRDCPIELVGPSEAIATFARALPVARLAAPVDAEPGRLDGRNAPAVIEAIARAVGDVRSGYAGAVVTNPIHKKTLYEAGFR